MSSFRQRRSWCPFASPSPRTAPFDYADIGIIEGTCPSCSILKIGKPHKMSLQGRKCAPKDKSRKNRTKLAWDHPGLHKLFRCQICCRCGNIFQHTVGRIEGGARGGWTNPKPMGIYPGVGGIQERKARIHRLTRWGADRTTVNHGQDPTGPEGNLGTLPQVGSNNNNATGHCMNSCCGNSARQSTIKVR